MFSTMNAKQVEIQGELRKKAKYEAQLEDFNKELETIEESVSQLQILFESEKKDVEKLEVIGLPNLFATLFGNKEEKLSKEKQEMLAVQIRLEENEKTKMEIETSINELQDKLLHLQNAEVEYQQLLLEKERAIKSSGSPFSAKLFDLSEQEGVVQAYKVELDEAIAAGDSVKHALVDARNSLEKAADWGTLDMFSDGMVFDLVKHQHIDDAKDCLHQAQTKMRKFQKELLDVQEQANLSVDISGMLKFADFFFDGLIADFMVQEKINQSLEQTRNHETEVNDLLLRLKAQSEEKIMEIENIQNEKQEIIERS